MTMTLLTGLLYVATGLVLTLSELLFMGAMLGFTTPALSLRNTLMSGLYSVGPSMLVLVGLAVIFDRSSRISVSLISSVVVIAGLVFWSGPRIGWPHASQLILEPMAMSLFIGSITVVKIKRRWILAAIASGLSSPLYVLGVAYWFYEYFLGLTVPSLLQLYVFVPAALVILSFISALYFRRA